MQKTLKQKIISAITGASMLLGGLVVSDVAVDTPAEKLETALAPYDLTIEDITPFTQEKIEIAKESKDFTNDEKAVLEAVLKGQGILYFSDGNINTNDIFNIYLGILNKSDLKYDDVKNVTDINKLIRQKYE